MHWENIPRIRESSNAHRARFSIQPDNPARPPLFESQQCAHRCLQEQEKVWGVFSNATNDISFNARPHPALSPRRGFSPGIALLIRPPVRPIQRLDGSNQLGTFLPLPGGEGRGEGEQSHILRLDSLNHHPRRRPHQSISGRGLSGLCRGRRRIRRGSVRRGGSAARFHD